MNTPICDFLERYAEEDAVRLHMPGHKGRTFSGAGRDGSAESQAAAGAGSAASLRTDMQACGETGSGAAAPGWSTGAEHYDITEIEGADSLYEADGIIRESEQNAGSLFGAETFYSAEGSSLCIRAMLCLVAQYARERGERPRIAAGRNAHRVFVGAAALLDMEVEWLLPPGSTYLGCPVTRDAVRDYLSAAHPLPTAVYLTSPDYTGTLADVRGVAEVCRERGVLLLVDNAHGAYLKFLSESLHPMDLGADLCCDSAHKTLPALTGRLSAHLPEGARHVPPPGKAGAGAVRFHKPLLPDPRVARCAQPLSCRGLPHGAVPDGSSPEADAAGAGREGACNGGRRADEADPGAAEIRIHRIIAEYADPDVTVLMPSVRTGDGELERLEAALLSLPRRAPLCGEPPAVSLPVRVMSPREALLGPEELLPVGQCVGRVAASVTVGCPPAVPVVAPGERIDDAAIRCFEYYGIRQCAVVREPWQE